ncbi:hypothetical protein BGX34_008153 [Mortierella sp. NVP85]|nr:hypothetical protein BGX34_008153 [Mortierella sp. NVP85]
MKFAKYLQDEVVPEWRKAYINYKKGKQLLKEVDRALDLLEAEAQESENDPIPGYILDTTDLENGILGTSPPSVPPQPQPSTISTAACPQTNTAVTSSTNAATPILSQSRGHTQNYSTITNPPPLPSTLSATSLLVPAYAQGAPALEDDRSGSGGSTLYESNLDSMSSTALPDTQVRSDLGVSQLGHSARAQGSRLLKSISRRFTVIMPYEEPARTRSIRADENDFDSVLEQLLPEEREFFRFLDAQLEMINNFYREKELEAVTKLRVIKQQLCVANEWKRRYDDKMAKAEAERGWYAAEWSRVREGIDDLMHADTPITEDVTITPSKRLTPRVKGTTNTRLDPQPTIRRREPHFDSRTQADELVYQDDIVLQEEEQRRQRLNHKVARTRIKAAMYEFYRSLEMIKNYKVLNHTGFAKILKKFDKTAGWKSSKSYMNSRLKPAYFMNSGTIEDLIKKTEDLFVDAFEKGHRRRAMAKLRIPDSKGQTYHWTTTRIGLYLGLAAPLMVQALQAAFSSDTPAEIPYWDGLLLVYAGLFLTILFACLFGINMYVWTRSRINYKFIFEFDPRDNLDYREYFELPVFLMLLLTLAVYLDFGSKLTAHVATAYWPLILMVIIACILFCPLPIAHFTSRRWFISSIGRILASGYYRVEFRDFFLADEMNSLSYSIEQFEFAMCAYSQQWSDLGNTCSTSNMWITPFLTALPPWFRFLQCLRRYRDTLEWFPHLLNAGKYSSGLINIFVYFSYRHYGGPRLKLAYILMSTLTSIYTFTWDIYMDWGLFRFGKRGGGAYGHPFLRQELVYSRMWVYYMAIALDFVGRFSWLVRLIPLNVNVMVLSFTLALLEVLRRWQWNFFRLENEHLNNCGQFRAIKDIPLPFHIRVKSETDDEGEYGSRIKQENREDSEGTDSESHEYRNTHDPEEEEGGYSSTQPTSNNPPSARRPGFVRYPSAQGNFGRFSEGTHAHNPSNLGVRGGHKAVFSSYTPLASTSPPQNDNRSFIPGGQSIAHKKRSLSYHHGVSYPHEDLDTDWHHNPNNSNSHSDNHQSDDPFHLSHGNSLMDNVDGRTAFRGAPLEVLEPGTNNSNNNIIGGSKSTNDKKFYGRRDFDAKIIDNDNNEGLWSKRRRAMTGMLSLHGLERISAGGSGSEASGPENQALGHDRRVRSQGVSKKRMSVGTRVKSAIFGQRKNSSDEDDEDDTD